VKQKKFTEKDINILTWREAVRKRPAMYTGSTGIQGFVNILQSFFANIHPFIDSARLIEAECFSFEITDNQAGQFRFDKLKTKISSHINEELYPIGFEFAVLNALSQNYEFAVFDKNKNEILKQIYQRGILQSGIVDEKEYFPETIQIKFALDESIWERFELNPIFISDLIKEIAFLNKTKTYEIKYAIDEEPCRVIYHFKDGLKELIDSKKPKSSGSTVFDTYLEKDFKDFSVEMAFAFWDYSINEPFFKSFVNNHYTHEKGTHANAFTSGIIRASKKYVKKYLPEEYFVITKRTVYSFLLAGIHLKMKQPRFYGSTRNQLCSREIIKPFSDYIAELLFEKFESDKENAQKVMRHFYEIHWNNKWLKRI
jgi:DNA gyrase subunit B